MKASDNERAQLAMLALEYGPGQHRLRCPRCHGGWQHEISLSLSSWPSGAWYIKCWRASCDLSAASESLWGRSREDFNSKVQITAKAPALVMPDTILPPERSFWYEKLAKTQHREVSVHTFCAKFGFSVLSEDYDVLVIELVRPDGTKGGYVTRTPDKRIKTFKNGDGPLLYSNLIQSEGVQVLVEDAVSAAVLGSHGVSSVALMGTHLADDVIARASRPSKGGGCYVVALDPGAEIAAAKAAAKLRAAGCDAVAWPLREDIKDMSYANIRALIHSMGATP